MGPEDVRMLSNGAWECVDLVELLGEVLSNATSACQLDWHSRGVGGWLTGNEFVSFGAFSRGNGIWVLAVAGL